MPSWGNLLNELQPTKDASGNDVPGLSLDGLREKYLKKLSSKTGRNVIAYYSGWLKSGKDQNVDINDSDNWNSCSVVYSYWLDYSNA